MPRLPKGMFRRRSSYYTRLRKNYGDRWICLGKDYEEACRRLRELKTGPQAARPIRIEEAADQWLETYVRNARNEKGVKLAGWRLERYFKRFFRFRDLAAASSDDLRRYRVFLERQGIAPLTVFHVLADANCFFGWCLDSGLLARNPFPRKLMPRIQERPPDRLSAEAVKVLIALPEPYGFTARLGLGTGLRWGELMRAERSDVQSGMLVVHQTKSGKIRRVPLPPELLAEVEARTGRLLPFDPPTPGHFTRKVKKLTGLKFHPHQMRHTFACRWLEQGGSLAALQAILGHSSVVTTQRYARLSDDHVRAEADRINRNNGAFAVASGPIEAPAATATGTD